MKWNPDYTLRDYQQDSCRKAVDGFTKTVNGVGPFQRQLGIAATGAGKTIMAAAMVYWNHKARKRRTLFIAPSDELVGQAQDKVFKATGEYASIEKAESYASLDAPFVVASFQSLTDKRRRRFPSDHFGLVIADEGDLSLAATYKASLEYFDGGGSNSLAITATPERSDKKQLMDWYQNVAFEVPMIELINRGYLAKITVQNCPIVIDATNVTDFGDESDELESVIAPWYEAIIDQWQEHASDRKTLVFHPTRHASKSFVALMKKRGIDATHIEGGSKNRKKILQRFEERPGGVLSNAQLLTAGYDNDKVSCVINLKPDRSRRSYTQKVGRGARLKPEGFPQDCLLLDFLWQFKELNVLDPFDLFTENEEVAAKARFKAREGGQRADLNAVNIEAEREREDQIIARLKANANQRGGIRDAREFAAELRQADLIDYAPSAGWEFEAPTQAQLDVLSRWTVDPATVESRGHATKLITRVVAMKEAAAENGTTEMLPGFLIERATIQQRGRMTVKGIKWDESTTKEQASRLIAAHTEKYKLTV